MTATVVCSSSRLIAPEMDAALLLLPTVEFVDWRDERMLRTTAAIREELDAGDGLLYRYRRSDGLPGREGAFLCCSFWLAECLAHQDGSRMRGPCSTGPSRRRTTWGCSRRCPP